MTELIDFDANIPYYQQLMDIIKTRIGNKEWSPGEKISSEHELCDKYHISRSVIRQALKELEIEGIISRIKGKGTFISEPKIKAGFFQKITSFYQDMVDQGLKTSTRVLNKNVVACNGKVAAFLDLKPGTKVIDIRRLRFVDDKPIQLVTNYIPFEICPALADIDLTDKSLYESMERICGIKISKASRYIEARLANDSEAELMETQRNAPLIILESVSYTADDVPVEYYYALHCGTRTRFRFDL